MSNNTICFFPRNHTSVMRQERSKPLHGFCNRDNGCLYLNVNIIVANYYIFCWYDMSKSSHNCIWPGLLYADTKVSLHKCPLLCDSRSAIPDMKTSAKCCNVCFISSIVRIPHRRFDVMSQYMVQLLTRFLTYIQRGASAVVCANDDHLK